MPNNRALQLGNFLVKILMATPGSLPFNAFQIGIALKHARESIGWTIEDLSRKTGISPREVSSIEDQIFTMFYGHLPLLETKLRIYARKTGVMSDDFDSMIRDTIETLKPQLKGQ